MTDVALEDAIVAALRRIVRAIDLHSRRLEQTSGLTGPQIVVLREIVRREECTVGALALAVSLTQPTVSGIVDRLEAQAAVRRARGKQDRRTTTVRATALGRRKLAKAPPLLQDRVRSEINRLPARERTQILTQLQRIAAMMDAAGLEAAPVLETTQSLAAPPRKRARKR